MNIVVDHLRYNLPNYIVTYYTLTQKFETDDQLKTCLLYKPPFKRTLNYDPECEFCNGILSASHAYLRYSSAIWSCEQQYVINETCMIPFITTVSLAPYIPGYLLLLCAQFELLIPRDIIVYIGHIIINIGVRFM